MPRGDQVRYRIRSMAGPLRDYENDVFLSFAHATDSGQWVREHFHRALVDALNNTLPREPRVFVDWRQPTGVAWRKNIARALHASRLLVPVFCPPYFRSRRC